MNRVGEYVTGPGTPAWLRQCTWQTWTLLEKDQHYNQFSEGDDSLTADDYLSRGQDPNELWGAVACPINEHTISVNPNILPSGILSTWTIDDGLPQLVLDYIVARAYASVELPIQLGDAAPYGDEQAPMITQLPTWLWIDPTIWQPVAATTPELFGVTATVTATPTRVVFHGADDWVDCGPNLGPAYDFTRPGHKQSSRCTLTWRHSSAVADHTLTSTITWAAAWSCNTGCGTGTLPDYTVTNTRPVRVAELQAVLLPPPATTP